MFYSVDMIPDPATLKDRFELVEVYTAPPPVKRKPATGAESCVPSPSFQMTTQAEPPCDHCRSPLFAATSCRVCGRKAEPK